MLDDKELEIKRLIAENQALQAHIVEIEKLVQTLKEELYWKSPLHQYTKDKKFIKCWFSVKEASINLGIDASNIYKCCNGKLKTAGGYIWKLNKY